MALILVTVISTIMGLDVTLIGSIPVDLPELKVNTLNSLNWFDLSTIIFPALTLAILGAIDTLSTSVVVDKKNHTKHNSNREMIGQGLGNMLSATIGGISGAGATMRTMVNINAGGRARISGIIHSTVLLIILFCASHYVELIPYLIPEKNLYLDFQSAIQASKVSHTVTIAFEENKLSLRMENVQNHS